MNKTMGKIKQNKMRFNNIILEKNQQTRKEKINKEKGDLKEQI